MTNDREVGKMYCPFCRQPLRDGAVFCNHCGRPCVAGNDNKTMYAGEAVPGRGHYRADPGAAPEQAPKHYAKKKVLVPLVAVLLAVVVLGLSALVTYLILTAVEGDNSQSPAVAATQSAQDQPESAVGGNAESNMIVMPDVSGKMLSDAQPQLEAMGLRVQIIEEMTDDIAAGYVMRQSIEPQQMLNPGDTVLLYVAKSSDPNVVETLISDPQYAEDVLYNTLCKEYVTLRSEPSMSATAITRIPKGASVYYISDVLNSVFIQVSYNGQTGFALSAFFTPENSTGGRYVMYCGARQYANLRSRPGSYDQYNIDSIPTNDPVQCTGNYEYVDGQKYLEVVYKNNTGYVLASVMNSEQKGATYTGN